MAKSHFGCVDAFVLETSSSGTRFKATVNRYRPINPNCGAPQAGYILLFAHGTGFHKEHWEPTLEELFSIDKKNRERNSPNQILEAWAIDCQNHGVAASLNEEVLLKNPEILTIYDYAEAFVTLFKSSLLGKIEKGVQKLVVIGHSAGAVGTVLTTLFFDPPSTIPWDMMILVEPPLFAPSMEGKHTPIYRAIEQATPLRRTIWESREAARTWLKARPPWVAWDSRILDLYVEFGLRALPTGFNSDKEGVVLSCHPASEIAAFKSEKESLKAIGRLGDICKVLPVHLIFGARNDMFSREMQDSINSPEEGRNIASVSRVRGAGHLVVQEAPNRLAQCFYGILHGRTTDSTRVPKL